MSDAMTETLPTVLLVDDEEHSLAAMRMALEDDFDCLCALSADEAEALMEDNFVQVVICDQRMPGRSGVDFLSVVRDRWPETVRIIITGYAETQDMIAAINDAGIYQLITKPWHPDQLIMMAKNASDLFRLNRDHERMSLEMRFLTRSVEHKLSEKRRALREGLGFEKILRTANSPMNPVVAQARQFASFDVSVMIVGESGTGKAEMARAIHYGSLRSDRAFHEVNCVGVDDRILEIELFGHKRGAIPGLQTNGVGLLQKADRGTLFLNGVESLSPRMQLQLQQVATEGVFHPVGGHETVRSNARLVAGSNHDLRAEVEAGSFRADLFYALAQTTLHLPPLRARLDDLAILAQEMLFEAASRHGKIVHGLCEDAVDFLKRYHWPGNMKELENEVLRMLIFAQDPVLGPELISRHILQAAPVEGGRDATVDAVLADTGSLKERVEQIEMRILRETLTRLKWNKSRAASELGLSRVGLRAKIERYGIEEPRKVGADIGDEEEE